MNAQELFLLRGEIIKAVAVLQPELREELMRMEAVYKKTQAAADIIGTAESVAKTKKAAEDYAYSKKAEADKLLGEVTALQTKIKKQQEEIVILQMAASRDRAAAAKLFDEQTASSATHATFVASETARLAQQKADLEARSDKLEVKAQGLAARERELAEKLKRMREISV